MNKLAIITSCAVALIAGACGGSQTAPVEPDSAGTPAAESTPAWKDMNRSQRMEFMGLTVLPEMKKIFQEYDAEGYADFKCQTCHGDDMKEVDYKMPNGLFALEMPDPIPASKDYDAPVTDFMMTKVVPKMANLMQMEPAKEFTCFSCHDAEEATQ